MAGQDHGVGALWLPTNERQRRGSNSNCGTVFVLLFIEWAASERRKEWRLGFALLPRKAGNSNWFCLIPNIGVKSCFIVPPLILSN